MTCIVGYVEGKVAWIVGDSAANDSSDDTMRIREDPKVFRNGPMIMGYAGSFRLAQVMRYELRIPPRPKGMEPFEFMVTKFIKAVKKCAHEHGINEEITESYVLVGYAGQLFCIEPNLQVAMNGSHFEAVGSGALLALGSMHTTSKLEMDPGQRMLLAMKAAAAFSRTVSPPFLLGWVRSSVSHGFYTCNDDENWVDYVPKANSGK